MPDRRVTLFELHTHGNVQFGPSSVPGIGRGSDEDEAVESVDLEEDSGGANTPLRVLLALGVLIAFAAAVRKYRGDGELPEVPLEESDEIAPTQD